MTNTIILSYKFLFKLSIIITVCSFISADAFGYNTVATSNTLKKENNCSVQPIMVSGKVTTKKGEPLPGVNISLKNTSKGVTTDKNGNYALKVPENGILVFSFIGFQTKNIPIKSRTNINVTMIEKISKLNNMVVIGYGSVKKSDLTGSVSSVKPEDIALGSVSSVSKQLGGHISGVRVTNVSGQPGSGTRIRIRGTSSILGNSAPLFVVDGVPVGTSNASVGPSVLQTIGTENIKSIEILKDASSTAIYGARGANGVVLITTKQGEKGGTKIDFNFQNGIQKLGKKIDLLNAEQLAQVAKQAISTGYSSPYNPDTVSGVGTDWQDKLYRIAPTRNYQLSVSGGNDALTYLISGSYLNKQGIVKNSYYNRYNIRSNINSNISEKLTVRLNLALTKDKANVPSSSGGLLETSVGGALIANPMYSVKDAKGNYTIFTDPQNRVVNPVGAAVLETRERNNNQIISNLMATYDFTDHLEAKANLGITYGDSENNSFSPNNTKSGFGTNGEGSVWNNGSLHWISNNTLTYNNDFNKNHSLKVMAGFTAERFHSESATARANDFVIGTLGYHLLEGGQNQFSASNLFEYQLASFISRINYNFQDKYLFTFTGRYDGSSKFGKNNKWAPFPSGAFAWRISNEPFLNNSPVISNLKLRASVGLSGEQAISSYQTLSGLQSVNQVMAGNTLRIGFIPTRLATPNLEWEKTSQIDLGLDIGLWEDRVTITSDVYYKKTTDLLYRVSIPQSAGYSSVLRNVGSLENKGVEFSIHSSNTTGDFQWDTNFNLSFNRNMILNLGNRADGSDVKKISSPAGGINVGNVKSHPSVLIKGEPLGITYGWIFDGTYKTKKEIANGPEPGKVPGAAKLRDLNHDGQINGEDRTIIADSNPDFTGGISNTLSYKGFKLKIFLNWVYGNQIFDYNHFYFSRLDGLHNTRPWALNAWTDNNRDSNIPKAGWDYRKHGTSTFHVEDGSYLRAKNITLGYTLPAKLLGKQVSKIRAYIGVDNAFTITKYPGYNPDVSRYGSNNLGGNLDEGVYPPARTYLIGLNLSL